MTAYPAGPTYTANILLSTSALATFTATAMPLSKLVFTKLIQSQPVLYGKLRPLGGPVPSLCSGRLADSTLRYEFVQRWGMFLCQAQALHTRPVDAAEWGNESECPRQHQPASFARHRAADSAPRTGATQVRP